MKLEQMLQITPAQDRWINFAHFKKKISFVCKPNQFFFLLKNNKQVLGCLVLGCLVVSKRLVYTKKTPFDFVFNWGILDCANCLKRRHTVCNPIQHLVFRSSVTKNCNSHRALNRARFFNSLKWQYTNLMWENKYLDGDFYFLSSRT